MVEEAGLFDFPKLEINKKIRLIELFGGIGSQAMALRDLGADFETYKLIEFDKYAIQSYNAIHGTNFKTTDIRNVRGVDLEIRERELLLFNDLFFSLYRFINCGQNERNVKRRMAERRIYEKRSFVGSRKDHKGIARQRTSTGAFNGKCTAGSFRPERRRF